MKTDSTVLFQKQKAKALEWRRSTAPERRARLKKLLEAVSRYEDQILEATQKDFGKPAVETVLTELLLSVHEITHAIKNVEEWMRPRSVSSGLFLLGARCEVHSDPRGVCLIIGPWNYPWQLALSPLAAALAAGNTVIMKPSELTPHCSALLQKILGEIFSEDEVAVVLGDKDTSTELLALPFDHIFFTGSTAVGKVVMQAASRHLSSVTLELGGKSPAIVDETADLAWAAERLLWGKWVNGGQTCVAPDTLFVHRSVWPNLQDEIRKAGARFAQRTNEDLSQIISPRHFERLKQMSKQSAGWKLAVQVGPDSTSDNERRWPVQFFELENAGLASYTSLAREEIFGPLMATVIYDDLSMVIDRLGREDKPLALYLFSKDKRTQERILRETTSGGLVINDVLVHLANPELPFGGVGTSGQGHYHGHFGFRAFSHEKAVLKQGPIKFAARFFQPPYSAAKLQWARRLLKI
ncbi:MAG: aldehyde dehydrogenase family protein [Bdellovibrionaceae bacterium]|nr:aldehyde dehydrogenase family protein [Pseudobdellovibrionaceae bacterium]